MSEDVFEITDFTTASDWERFVFDFEEVITRWRLNQKDSSSADLSAEQISSGVWTQKRETLRFSKTQFSLVFNQLEDAVECGDHLCVSAARDSQRSSMDWPKRSHCCVRYFGFRSFLVLTSSGESIASEDRIRLLVSSATLALTQTQCCLPLLVEWKPRLFCGVALNDSTRVDFQTIESARNSKFKHLAPLLELLRQELTQNETTIEVSIRMTFALNFENAVKEELKELQMSAVWPKLAEDAVIDSENHSDLDPNSTEKWTLRALFREHTECPQSESLALLMSLRDDRRQILDRRLEEQELRDALIPLTSDSSELKWIRDLLREELSRPQNSEQISAEDCGLKSAPVDALVWRVARLVARVYSERRETQDLALLWREFVQRLRTCWDERSFVPLCARSAPDLNFGLLQQKLQMLNVCIEETKDDDNSDDEFFDAEQDVTQRPEGRLRLSEWQRVSDPQEPIWVPETQEAPPVTEDMVSEQLAVLQRLGTSAESQALRARLQSASLLSDMEAFKAANISAEFPDFVRWHSPRDCDSHGRLSTRFSTEDNIWRQLWESAKPLAAKRQKPLFDAQTEAEKVLHFMTSLTFADLAELVIPIVVNQSLLSLDEKRKRFSVDSELKVSQIVQKVRQKDFHSVLTDIRAHELFLHRLSSVGRKLRVGAQDSSLSEEEIYRMAGRLVSETEVEIQSFGVFGQVMRRLFFENDSQSEQRDDSRRLSSPVAKEFILRAMSRRPSAFSRPLPQRLYCLWTEAEVRIASAFTQDLTYF